MHGDFGRPIRIFEDSSRICKRTVDNLKIVPSAVETSDHIFPRYVTAAI
jgi:hypothetical protein